MSADSFSENPEELFTHLKEVTEAARHVVASDDFSEHRDNKLRVLRECNDALFQIWICGRNHLKVFDDPAPVPDRRTLPLSVTHNLWMAMATVYVALSIKPDGIKQYEATQSTDFQQWKLRPFAEEVMQNEDGYSQLNVAPCKASCEDIEALFDHLAFSWRKFDYRHVDRINECMLMVLHRCLVLTVARPETSCGEARHINFVYEADMICNYLMIQGYVIGRFRRTAFAEWPGFDEEEYRRLRIRVDKWIQSRIQHKKFKQIETSFRFNYKQSCILPSSRERVARLRGLTEDEITTEMLVDDGDTGTFESYLAYLKQPECFFATIKEEIGTTTAQHIAWTWMLQMYLSTGFKWEFIEESTVSEQCIRDIDLMARVQEARGPPQIVQLFNGYACVYKGCYFPCMSFLDVFTQFLLIGRETTLARNHTKFFDMMWDENGIEVSELEMATLQLPDYVFYADMCVVQQPFQSDDDSDDEAGAGVGMDTEVDWENLFAVDDA